MCLMPMNLNGNANKVGRLSIFPATYIERPRCTHIVNKCNIRRLQGGMKESHKATTDAVHWLKSVGIQI